MRLVNTLIKLLGGGRAAPPPKDQTPSTTASTHAHDLPTEDDLNWARNQRDLIVRRAKANDIEWRWEGGR